MISGGIFSISQFTQIFSILGVNFGDEALVSNAVCIEIKELSFTVYLGSLKPYWKWVLLEVFLYPL